MENHKRLKRVITIESYDEPVIHEFLNTVYKDEKFAEFEVEQFYLFENDSESFILSESWNRLRDVINKFQPEIILLHMGRPAGRILPELVSLYEMVHEQFPRIDQGIEARSLNEKSFGSTISQKTAMREIENLFFDCRK